MFLFFVDQRLHRERCREIIESVPLPVPPGHKVYVPLAAAMLKLHHLLGQCTLVKDAARGTIVSLVEDQLRAGDVERCRQMLDRVVPRRGAVLRWRVANMVGLILLAGAIAWRWWPRGSVIGVLAALALLMLPIACATSPFVEMVLRSGWSHEYWRSIVRHHQLALAVEAKDSGRMLALYRASRMVAHSPGARAHLVEGYVFGMSKVAAWAADAHDPVILDEVYNDARRLIDEGRVPLGTGHHLADVLKLAVRGLPKGSLFPVDAPDVLKTLLLCAPESAFDYAATRDRIIDFMYLHTAEIGAAHRRARKSDDPVSRISARAFYERLRTLAHTAPGGAAAREEHAAAIGELARQALENEAVGTLQELLDDIDALVKKLESFEKRRSRTVDDAGPTLVKTLEQVARAAADPATVDRALVLLRRLATLFRDEQAIYYRTLEATGRAPKSE